MPATRADLLAAFERLGIETTTRSTRRSSPSSRARRCAVDPGGHTKNLFLKDKKDAVFLVVAEEDAEVDMKSLHKRIGSARLSFRQAGAAGRTARRDSPARSRRWPRSTTRPGRVTVILTRR
jgi:Ala-tRNA(Pro) deacylase